MQLHPQAEAVQKELDKLGSTLRQIQAYNDSMKGEIAVTRRAAYAAEEAVQKLEKEKMQQDYLIDDLQVLHSSNTTGAWTPASDRLEISSSACCRSSERRFAVVGDQIAYSVL